jgi:hypothetical protein
MAHRSVRWSRLIPITALLVVTTGVAASPIRDAWLPLVSNPLGFWNNTTPTPTAKGSTPPIASAGIRRDNAELEAPFVMAPDRMQFLVTSPRTARAANSVSKDREEKEQATDATAAYSSTSSPSRRGRNTRGGGSGGGGDFVGGGGLNGSRASPSIGSPRSYPKTNARVGGGSSNGNGRPSSPGSGGGSAAAPAPPAAGGVFNDHMSGMPDLTGKGDKDKNGPGNDKGKGPNLASSPEPSSLMLFATGLAAAAGAVRRRLRR